MSADEIVFGEVSVREPTRARRPDRDPELATLAYQTPRPGDLPIFLDRRPADAIERHALRDTSVELGGILLGRECLDELTGEPFVRVTESLEAKHYENTQASFTYTHDSWEELTRERDRLHPGLDIVGWYHTHPDFGIFLSGHDLFLHRNFFSQPLQVAYVIDPIRQDRGFFRWRGDTLEQVGGFHLAAPRAERLALARQVNDLEAIPNLDAAGAGFSPRLEAELMAALSRPHHAPPSSTTAADRALAAVVFLSVGLLGGGGIVALASYLGAMNTQLQAQTVALASLQSKLDRSEQIGQAAVATLLAREGASTDPQKFVDELTRARANLDRAEAARQAQETLAAAAATENRRISGELGKAVTQVDKIEAEAHGLKDELDRQRAENKALVAERDALQGTEAGQALHRADSAWYAALAGWIVATLIAVAWAGLHWLGGRSLPPASPARVMMPPVRPGPPPPPGVAG